MVLRFCLRQKSISFVSVVLLRLQCCQIIGRLCLVIGGPCEYIAGQYSFRCQGLQSQQFCLRVERLTQIALSLFRSNVVCSQHPKPTLQFVVHRSQHYKWSLLCSQIIFVVLPGRQVVPFLV